MGESLAVLRKVAVHEGRGMDRDEGEVARARQTGDKPVQKLPCDTTPHSKLVQLWQ